MKGSTAGARWRFAELEWLRRVGRGRASKDAFKAVRERIESSSHAELKARLAELQARKLQTPDRSREAPLTAEVLLIQGELGWRRSRGEADGAKRVAYEQIILTAALSYFISALGEGEVRSILFQAAEDSSRILPESFDAFATIDNWITYKSPGPSLRARKSG